MLMNGFRIYRSTLTLVALSALLADVPAEAQSPTSVHFRHPSQTPLGLVGMERLRQGGPVEGYFQPVQFTAQNEMKVSLAADGEWTDESDKVLTGLTLGQAYRLKVSNLALFPGKAVYPTIEVIDRTYPPVGMELRFPIPIVFNEDDVRLAMQGMFVTRVVYVEDPQMAIPGAQKPGEQLWHDAGSSANALEVADRLGRPVAIVRLGGRVPDDARGPDYAFQLGCPKWLLFTPPTTVAAAATDAPALLRPQAVPQRLPTEKK